MMEDTGGKCMMRNLIAFTPSKDDEMDTFGMKCVKLWCGNLLKDDPSGHTGIVKV
jgi:hypothetical protein